MLKSNLNMMKEEKSKVRAHAFGDMKSWRRHREPVFHQWTLAPSDTLLLSAECAASALHHHVSSHSLLAIILPYSGVFFIYLSIMVDIRYHINFRCATQWLDNNTLYEVIPWLVPIWHHKLLSQYYWLYSLCWTLQPHNYFYNWHTMTFDGHILIVIFIAVIMNLVSNFTVKTTFPGKLQALALVSET